MAEHAFMIQRDCAERHKRQPGLNDAMPPQRSHKLHFTGNLGNIHDKLPSSRTSVSA